MAVDSEGAQITLRDTISQALDAAEQAQTSLEVPASAPAAAPEPPATATPAAPERPRDPQTGKFIADDRTPEEIALDERAEQKVAKSGDPKLRKNKGFVSQTKSGTAPQGAAASTAATPPPTPAAAVPVSRPSSWKKDHWGDWDKMVSENPKLAAYIVEREGQYAKGVSAYKAEYDRAKPVADALAPYLGVLQSRNIQPQAWVQNMARAEYALLTGSPQDKLSMFMKLAQDYQIPLAEMFTQGTDGKLYFNPQVQAYQAPAATAQPQQDVRQTVQEILSQEKATQQLAAFEQEVASGKYQHYETVRQEMARLLESGFAETIEQAYDKALRMNDELFASVQEEKRQADEAERQRKAQEAASLARRNAISPRTATPATSSNRGATRSVRDTIEEAFDQHIESGRV